MNAHENTLRPFSEAKTCISSLLRSNRMADASSHRYALGRGGEEIQRLNQQHDWFKELNNGELLHRSLPVVPKSLSSVADVGCGTGIWLLDFAQTHLASTGTGESAPKLVGFDISSQQFPTDEQAPYVQFVVHDITTPFPNMYHNMFELVHVKALALELQKRHIAQAVRHVQQILKPGGILHRVDVEYVDLKPISAPPILSSVWKRIEGIVLSFGGSLGLPSDVMQTILDEDRFSLKVFEKKPIPFSDTKNRARGHKWLCRIWEIMITKDSRMQEDRLKAASAQSVTEEEKTRIEGSMEEDRGLVEGLRHATNDSGFEMQYPLTWIVAQKR